MGENFFQVLIFQAECARYIKNCENCVETVTLYELIYEKYIKSFFQKKDQSILKTYHVFIPKINNKNKINTNE